MRKSELLGTSAIGSAAVLSLSLGCATPALAQGDATAAADQGEQPITVTGSRIRRPNLESTRPIPASANR
jgi:hypothetical protein